MNLAIGAISAKRGGAVTYLRNVLPELARQLGAGGEAGAHRIVVWRGVAATADERWPEGVEYRQDGRASGGTGAVGGSWRRLWYDQVQLPRMLRADKADVLFSTANFGPWRCPCRHVLLVRNAAYFDRTFLGRMPSAKVRAYYTLQRWLTLSCLRSADVVLFPSRAMLEQVAPWAGGAGPHWVVAPYGTRHDLFRPAEGPGPEAGAPLRLLNVSLYSDQKNLGTLLEALSSLGRSDPGRYRLRLTAGFDQDWHAGSAFFPNFERERAAYRRLAEAGAAEDIDWKTYGALPDLYRASDVFVFPSYIESFGHPLIEAMASGLPVVAADVPVNREICGDAAVYFSTFDAADCASAIRRVGEDERLRGELRSKGLERARAFRWDDHVAHLVRAFTGS